MKADHELKTHPEQFTLVATGLKTAEFRKDDRGFKVGDWLKLCEWCPKREAYTGRFVFALVTCKTTGFGIPEGFAMLSIRGAFSTV